MAQQLGFLRDVRFLGKNKRHCLPVPVTVMLTRLPRYCMARVRTLPDILRGIAL